MGKRFMIYGFAGWCIEVFWTGIGSLLRGNIKLQGWTYIWMFPIYGLAVFMEPIHDKMRSWHFVFRGGVYTALIFLTEYTSGWMLRVITGLCPWDYSGSPSSVNGLIRLDYAPAWFVAGLLFERLHDWLMGVEEFRNA
ncbi:MAG TPA: hypothetical protein DD429_06175 [Clostridiaceae bacterium]|nr:hypothetical protein [Clostridiaceae bacterium]